MWKNMNIYAYIYVMYVLGKLVGMAPYQVIKHKKSFFCKASKKHTTNFIITAFVTTVMATRYIVIVTTTYENPEAKKSDLVLAYIYGFKLITSLSTIMIFGFKQNQFITTYRRIYECDLKLQLLGMHVSYVRHILVSIFVFASTVTYGYLAHDIHFESSAQKDFFLEKVSTFLHSSIQSLALQYFCFYIAMIYKKFKIVNDELASWSGTCKMRNEVFLKITGEIYGNLCCGMRSLNEVFGVTLFWEIIFNLSQSLQITYMILIESNSSYYLILWIIRNIIVLIVIIFPPALLTYQVRRISRHLGDIDAGYTDEKVAIIKNSFLLEILQNTINIKCVFFDISLSQLFNQVTVCISILLFMYQVIESNI